MIKNVVFDLGRVLIEYEPVKYLKDMGYTDEKIKEFAELIFLSPLWLEMDRGKCSIAEATEIHKAAKPHLVDDIDRIMSGLRNIFSLKEDTEAFFRKIKTSGYKIYILSNFAREGFEYVSSQYDFFKLSDGRVVSYEVGCIKPERQIYDILMEKYGLLPEETVFIDDGAVNIEAARELGMHAILFDNAANVSERFDELIKAV